MPYRVEFVGLVCFQAYADGKGRRALLPDGRFPEPDVQPHIASISVRTRDLLGFRGWYDEQVAQDEYETEFLFPPSYIELPSTNAPGRFTEKNVVSELPSLKKLDRRFNINDNANWIGYVDIRNGRLEAVLPPGMRNPADSPLIAELTVPHEEDIIITVTARKGWPKRTIRLRAGSEIAIVNLSRGLAPKNQRSDHFQIYGELSSAPVKLRVPKRDAHQCRVSRSKHPTFRQPRPASHTPDCIVTIVDPDGNP